MNERVLALMEDILASCDLVRAYTDALPKDAFLATTQVQDAVLRRIEIIGEGVKNLPMDIRDAHPEVPWRQIARMRDMLIHRYFSVDLDMVWRTATHDVPDLERQLSAIRDELREQQAGSPDVGDGS